MNLTIRRLNVHDAADLRSIRLAALKDAPTAFTESYDEAIDYPIEKWRSQLEANFVLGLFEDDQILGMAQIVGSHRKATQHRAWLTGVYLDPRLRSTGAADKLMEQSIAGARTLGVLQLHLGVSDFNKGTRKLYEKFGFRSYGTDPRGLRAQGQYVDQILMVRFFDEETKQ